MKNFADRLLDAIDEKGNPSCVGLDPRFKNIPSYIREEKRAEFGPDLGTIGECIFEFNKGIIDAVHDVVPVVKPQMAFYEQYGSAGVNAFQRTASYAKNKGLLVIEDAKRNDIGSTAQAYADGHLGKVDFWDDEKVSVFDVDAITVNSYLGSDGVKPFVENCKEHGKGIFALVKTSNPSSGEIQDKNTAHILLRGEEYQPTVFTDMAKLVDKWGQDVIGERGYSSVGAVVGATYPEQAEIARKLMPNSIILVPGYGAQGGGAKEVLPNFNKDGYGAIVNSSRGIIFAYQRGFKRDETDFDGAARDAALAMKEDITSALKEAGIMG